MNVLKKLFVGVLIALCTLAPISPMALLNFSQAQDGVIEIASDELWSGEKIISGDVVVNNNVTLTVKQGASLLFEDGATLTVQGKLVVDGSVKEPVNIARKDTSNPNGFYSIVVNSIGNAIIRNADISGGGQYQDIYQVNNDRYQQSFINTAEAFAVIRGAMTVEDNSTISIEGSVFHNNQVGIYVQPNHNFNSDVVVHRSKFVNNMYDVINEQYDRSVDARYNWWNNANGPEKLCDDCSNYVTLGGDVTISDWAKQEDMRDPVIILPGIIGSKEKDGVLVLDPVLHTYDKLYDAFISAGYASEQNLFAFPYEWRDSNVETAKLLQTKIQEIKQMRHWPKVDVVAHSMGGLVAREYIEGNAYRHDIDQLVTIGTPQSGSPESYLVWDGGVFGTGFQNALLEKYFKHEATENGYDSIFEYVRKRPILSVRELLPIDDYLFSVSNNIMRTYPEDYPINAFLENLNTPQNKSRLFDVEFTKIIGKLDGENTTQSIRTEKPSLLPESLWGHGYPEGYDNFIGNHGLVAGEGDGTVPLASAQALPSDYMIELNATHMNLPTVVTKDVIETLIKTRPADPEPHSFIKSIFATFVFSPIDIQIVSPTNKRVGKNFETGGTYNEIPGAYYTGYQANSEFITIPDPEDGEYKIFTQGTGEGEYRIETTKITDQGNGKDATESTVNLTGIATPDQREEKKIDIKDTEIVSQEKKDTIAPETHLDLSGTQGTNGWYVSDVSATLSATDNEGGSGVDMISYSIDKGATWQTYVDAIIFSKEEIATFQYFATDKQGNKEAVKTADIKIDKTAPEAKIVFNPLTQKLDIIGTDNISTAVSVSTIESVMPEESSKKGKWWQYFQKKKQEDAKIRSITTLTDEAGHTLVLTFLSDKNKDKEHRVEQTLQSIAYDGVVTNLSETNLKYQWQMQKRKNVYAMFVSHLRSGSDRLESQYRPKQNVTVIMQKPKESDDEDDEHKNDDRPVRETLPGMVMPYLQTNQGRVTIGVE